MNEEQNALVTKNNEERDKQRDFQSRKQTLQKCGLIQAYESMIQDFRTKGIPQLAPKIKPKEKPTQAAGAKKGKSPRKTDNPGLEKRDSQGSIASSLASIDPSASASAEQDDGQYGDIFEYASYWMQTHYDKLRRQEVAQRNIRQDTRIEEKMSRKNQLAIKDVDNNMKKVQFNERARALKQIDMRYQDQRPGLSNRNGKGKGSKSPDKDPERSTSPQPRGKKGLSPPKIQSKDQRGGTAPPKNLKSQQKQQAQDQRSKSPQKGQGSPQPQGKGRNIGKQAQNSDSQQDAYSKNGQKSIKGQRNGSPQRNVLPPKDKKGSQQQPQQQRQQPKGKYQNQDLEDEQQPKPKKLLRNASYKQVGEEPQQEGAFNILMKKGRDSGGLINRVGNSHSHKHL